MVTGTCGYLFTRPWMHALHGYPMNGSGGYAEQSLRWVSWYLGWPAGAAAGGAAVALTWQIARQGDDGWAVPLPIPLGSTV
jgi:hypothetical protein